MRSAAPLTLAVVTVASVLVRTRRSHRASGRASTRRLAAPQRRTLVLGQQRRHAMNTPTVRTRLVLVLAPLVFAMFGATSSAFACVVGTGTSASCTEAALDACLPGGGSFDGTVTFACGGAATITVTTSPSKTISADTTIDGGSLITISGDNAAGVLLGDGGVIVRAENLTIANGNALNGGNIIGGAIENNGGTVTVSNSIFSGNSAADGGAI